MSEKPDQFKGYTPGPWRIRGERYKFIRVYATLGGIAHLDTVDSEGMENARLIAAAPSLLADNERLTADNERLKADNERLRDELRQSSIDHTRAEVERLREALEIIAGYRQCVDSLMGNQDVAIAALRREDEK